MNLVDNDNFPTQLYVREARRLNGEYIMTQKNCQGEETVGDADRNGRLWDGLS